MNSRSMINERFEHERERIRSMIEKMDTEARARRVLIARVRGLEDSSRYWSAWMVLDHLRIVNGSIIRTIRSLTSGQTPTGMASTATVKPSPDVRGEVVVEYEKTCGELLETVAAVKDLKTRARYAHPWFGPLDAAGWHALAAGHMGIHRRQIERIMAAQISLDSSPPQRVSRR